MLKQSAFIDVCLSDLMGLDKENGKRKPHCKNSVYLYN